MAAPCAPAAAYTFPATRVLPYHLADATVPPRFSKEERVLYNAWYTARASPETCAETYAAHVANGMPAAALRCYDVHGTAITPDSIYKLPQIVRGGLFSGSAGVTVSPPPASRPFTTLAQTLGPDTLIEIYDTLAPHAEPRAMLHMEYCAQLDGALAPKTAHPPARSTNLAGTVSPWCALRAVPLGTACRDASCTTRVDVLSDATSAWPRHLLEHRPSLGQRICFCAAGSFCDFWVNTWGTPRWYGLLVGAQTLCLVAPDAVVPGYADIFSALDVWAAQEGWWYFGDTVACARVHLEAGDIAFLPAGWIIATYTHAATAVLSSSYVDPRAIPTLLRCVSLEDAHCVRSFVRIPGAQDVFLCAVMLQMVEQLRGSERARAIRMSTEQLAHCVRMMLEQLNAAVHEYAPLGDMTVASGGGATDVPNSAEVSTTATAAAAEGARAGAHDDMQDDAPREAPPSAHGDDRTTAAVAYAIQESVPRSTFAAALLHLFRQLTRIQVHSVHALFTHCSRMR